MSNDERIRASKEFKELVDYIRAKCMLYQKKCPSIAAVTKKIAEAIDKEKLYQNEFCK